ncbi:MAG: hypothetical protein EXR83_13210 [Gammaproteobacteria bacterium]|nr:hypothetical protein [Gammaproteobacteria bacterium]
MRLEDENESANIEDRRGNGRGRGRGRGIGIGTIAIVLLVSYFTGIDPQTLLSLAGNQQNSQAPTHQQANPSNPASDPEAAQKSEMAKVLYKTEIVWSEVFRSINGQYQKPVLVLYRGQTPTACGLGQAAMGPFYCPGDQKVYLDMAFFEELKSRFGAGGDFARAYVIAHEIGHHVQNLLGISRKTAALRAQLSETQYNKVAVRVELQADCLAGLWAQEANRGKAFLDPQDIDEALHAANAIGDDMLQKQSRGIVVPDSFTHGTSAQRVHWFKRGFEAKNLQNCDTFSTGSQ